MMESHTITLNTILNNSKPKLHYNLAESYNNIFKELIKLFSMYDYKVFLFGSFSKGMMNYNSDIDLLLIVPDLEITYTLKRKIRNELENYILDLMFKYGKEIDIKIYGEIDFISSSRRNYFESSIIKDLILLENCVRR